MGNYSGVFRTAPYPTVYNDLRTSWNFDMDLIGIVAGYLVPSVCMLLLLPTLRFTKREILFFSGMFLYLWTGGIILVCTYGHGWSTATLKTRTPYISNSNLNIQAEIGVHVGLRGINVTLIGDPLIQANHTILYNERFWWGGEDVLLPSVSWGQGKEGFGPYAGQISQEFRKQLERGVPTPIQWVAEYWIMDGEYIRWGRYYRMGAYYCFQVQWVAWCIWFFTGIMFLLVPMYGAYFLGLTGLLMLLGCMLYGSLIQTVYGRSGPIRIPFQNGVLEPGYGWSFFLNLFWGLATAIVGGAFAFWLTYNRLNENKEENYRFSMELEPMEKEKHSNAMNPNADNWKQPNNTNNNNNNGGYNNNNNNNNNNANNADWNRPPKASNPPSPQYYDNNNNANVQVNNNPQNRTPKGTNRQMPIPNNNNANNADFYNANAYDNNNGGNNMAPPQMMLPPNSRVGNGQPRGIMKKNTQFDVQVLPQ